MQSASAGQQSQYLRKVEFHPPITPGGQQEYSSTSSTTISGLEARMGLGGYKGRSISVSVHQFYLFSILTRFRSRWAIRAAHCIATRTGKLRWGQHARNTKWRCGAAVPKPSADKISFTHNTSWPASWYGIWRHFIDEYVGVGGRRWRSKGISEVRSTTHTNRNI